MYGMFSTAVEKYRISAPQEMLSHCTEVSPKKNSEQGLLSKRKNGNVDDYWHADIRREVLSKLSCGNFGLGFAHN